MIKEHATLVPPHYHRCKYCQSAIIDTTRNSSIFWWLASRRTPPLFDVGGDGGWPILRVLIPDAVAAAEAGCAAFTEPVGDALYPCIRVPEPKQPSHNHRICGGAV